MDMVICKDLQCLRRRSSLRIAASSQRHNGDVGRTRIGAAGKLLTHSSVMYMLYNKWNISIADGFDAVSLSESVWH
jgi:hypothetical protein